MDILQFEHFIAVVNEGSFTRAAEKMRRTQPALSQSVKKLEDELGAPLFARDAHDVTLTETGKCLLEYARRIVVLRDEAVRTLGDLRGLSTGTLSIASHETAALHLLPGPLRAYARRFRDVRVGEYRTRLDDIPRSVLDREVDFGFVAEEPTSRDLQFLHIYSDELILIASPHHPLTARATVRISDLGSERFIVHHLCSSSARKILEVFHEHRTPFKVAAELWSFENVKDFVEQEIGLAIVPRVTVLRSLQAGSLKEIPIDGVQIPRRTYVIFRDRRYMSDAAQGLLRILSEFDWHGWHARESLTATGTGSRPRRSNRPPRLRHGDAHEPRPAAPA